MVISNVKRLGETGGFSLGELFVEDGKFASAGQGPVLDGGGCYAIPGLVDIHFHGCAGYDFCDGTQEALEAIADYEQKNGITSICPATMSLPRQELLRICDSAKEYQKNGAAGAELHADKV